MTTCSLLLLVSWLVGVPLIGWLVWQRECLLAEREQRRTLLAALYEQRVDH